MPLEVSLSTKEPTKQSYFDFHVVLADFLLCVRGFQKVPNSRSKKLKKMIEDRIKYSPHPEGSPGSQASPAIEEVIGDCGALSSKTPHVPQLATSFCSVCP